MKYRNFLDEVLGQKGKLKILRALIFSPRGLTAREIARKTGLTPWACIKVLRELETFGLVSMEKVGRANWYTLNRENFINREMLLPLFQKEKEIYNIMLKWLMSQISCKPVSVILFGSVARGEEKEESDIDLCFLTKDFHDAETLERKLEEIEPHISRALGKKLSPYIQDINTFKKKYYEGVGIIKEIVREGILLYGKPPSSFLKK
ncbi:nucleotidyltransferase domain-containing protein [Candidatus Calescamantes bacterium]|nr:nucleotidyltransferase domain-containing protein [Candidatus Calescamantes bacterium]